MAPYVGPRGGRKAVRNPSPASSATFGTLNGSASPIAAAPSVGAVKQKAARKSAPSFPAPLDTGNAAPNPLPRTGRGRGLRRHQKVLRDNIQGITKPSIRRLARRGGVKRISGGIYSDIRIALKQRLEDLLKKAALIVENANRKTVTTIDVVYALKQYGTTIYGFERDCGYRHV
ncbi:hypothetical protein CBER1_02257 [Cercospora berteroae]|uniref:Histone H4 n=1 Tax=Cercospora berteroae TaxID=357750 RepID=A0A2S6CB12_9PEZI|nr:hypothetical protein CBER1_02257 [Cercospora berteroae]